MAPFKSTQSFSVGAFLKTFRSRDAVGPAALNSPVRTNRIVQFQASGGTKIDGSDGFTYHIFQKGNTDTFSITEIATDASDTVEVLLIGGGGGGGKQHGGGGAAGALYHNPAYPIPAVADYTVTIGAGGASETSGSDSVFNDVTMNGGGAGGRMGNDGTAGGSGGGGGMNNNNPGPGTPVPGGAVTAPPTTPSSSPLLYANAGGSGSAYYDYSDGGIGGGGGGAGGAGTSAPPGPGLSDPKGRGGDDYLFTSIPTAVMPEIAEGLGTPTVLLGVPLDSPEPFKRAYAGGGAGGSHSPWSIYNPGYTGYGNHPDVEDPMGGGSSYRTGGLGGLGNTEVGDPGVEGRGGGGGGSGQLPTNGGYGGAGICIVKYATPAT